jgi:serine/threonine protein kinase
VLHGQQLIHRDIKLQNIMAQRCPVSGEIKVPVLKCC